MPKRGFLRLEKQMNRYPKGSIKKTLIRMIATIIAAVIALYLLILIFMYFMQSGMVYFPSRSVEVTPANIGLEYEDVFLETGDGVKINGWFVPANPSRTTLLFFHGNGGNISHRLESIQQFNSLGLSVFIIDYHGYGKSGGKPGEVETYLDAEAAWDYLTHDKGLDPGSIIIFGRSLGGGVATWLATKQRSKALIVESSFLSIPDVAGHYYPFLPVKILARFKYDSKANLSHIKIPILVVHSPDDDIIPYSHGQELYDLAGEPKQFLQINGSHNDGYLVSDHDYRRGIDKFLSSLEP